MALVVLGLGGTPPSMAPKSITFHGRRNTIKKMLIGLGRLTGIAYLCRGIFGVIHYSFLFVAVGLMG